MDHDATFSTILLLAILIYNSTVLNSSNTVATSQLGRPAGTINPFCLTPTESSSQAISPTENGTVAGNVLPDVRNHKYPFLSQLPDLLRLQMEVIFNLRYPSQLQTCLNSITDPTSLYYGNFLNSTTIQPFLPTLSQRSSVIQYLTANGFTVNEGASPLVLKVTGNAFVTSKAFKIGLGLYRTSNSTFYAADSDPTFPLNLSTLIGAVTGLENFTSFIHSQSACNFPYCPQGIQVGYSFANLFTNGFDGTGQNVAIVDSPGDPNIQTAINTYNAQYGLPSITITLKYPDGTPSSYDPGWASETAMDVEAVHTVAKGAGIVLLYDTGDLLNAIDYVAANNLAKVVSNSWTYGCGSSSCSDTQLSHGFVSSVHSRLMTDAAMGLTICFASGDGGAKPDGSNLGTEFPSSDPNVLAIGGTNLVLAGSCTNTCTGYGSETGWSGSGGGYSGFFAEPSWQTSTIGVKTGRAVPDVSMVGQGGAFWVYSTASDKCGRGGNSAGWFGCGGTSLSTPLWAGFIGILLQMKGIGSFGNMGPLIYQTASGPKYSTIFHDVTSGSNNGYSATAGWDPITGWGTPIANLLAQNLVQVTMTVSYTSLGGGNPTAPIFNYVLSGASKTYTLTTSPTNVTVDLGSSWSVTPNPLSGSTSTERWDSNQQLSGNAAAATMVFSFYHQYLATLSYSVTGGSGFTVPSFTGNQFGVPVSQPLQTTASGFWFDSGTAWSVPNVLIGTATERWITSQAVSGVMNAPMTVVFTYQHQYLLTTQANPTLGGTVSPPTSWENENANIIASETSNSGYAFYYWSLDGTNVGSSTSYSVLMNAAHTLTAHFRSTTTISISVSASSIVLGNSVTLSGQIVPSQSSPGIAAGTQVAISSSSDGGVTWNTIISTNTNSSGAYNTHWVPPYTNSTGTPFQLQANWIGNGNYAGSTSSSIPLIVQASSITRVALLISAPITLARGGIATVDVLATNIGPSLTTTLYIQIDGPSYTYSDPLPVILSSNSYRHFLFSWNIPTSVSPGTYTITAGLIPAKVTSIDQTQITVS